MAYVDNSIKPLRHIGRQRWAHSGLGPYLNPQAVVTGTFLTTPTEAEAITGSQTLIITLSRGAWISSADGFNSVRQAIIDQLIVSPQSESTGLALVMSTAVVGNVVRSSDTVVTVTLPAVPLYKISANETWEFRVPPTALHRRGGRIAATTSAAVTVVNSTGSTITAALTGTALAGGVVESAIVTGSETIICTLTNGEWVDAGATGFDAVRQAILDGLVSAQSEAAGWNVKRAGFAVTTVVRTSNTAVTITLPATASYAITSDEVITMTIPKAAIELADADLVATETITITANS